MDTLVTGFKVPQSGTRFEHTFLSIARDTRLEVDGSIKPFGNMCKILYFGDRASRYNSKK